MNKQDSGREETKRKRENQATKKNTKEMVVIKIYRPSFFLSLLK